MIDVVDFNKSCEEAKGIYLPLSGTPVYYYHCNKCFFTFAPDFENWSENEFSEKIYNDEYFQVDPDYLEVRPLQNFNLLKQILGKRKYSIKHLDYGGGNGKLSQHLKEDGWNSQTYDPFPSNGAVLKDLGKFNLITAFEVFEHVPDVHALMRNLTEAREEDFLILFSTLISDGNIKLNNRINWWYASPRNGHISLFSRQSLIVLGLRYNLKFGSFSEGLHCYFNKIPGWAEHLIRR
jgi:hypothetical protein